MAESTKPRGLGRGLAALVAEFPGGGTASVEIDVDRIRPNARQPRRTFDEGALEGLVESIRAGLVFQLKQAVGTDVIRAHEEHFLRRAVAAWGAHPQIQILGNVDAEFARGGKVMEAVYYTPIAAHASMEPPAAVAEFRNGKAEIWCPTQNPQAVQDTLVLQLALDGGRTPLDD